MKEEHVLWMLHSKLRMEIKLLNKLQNHAVNMKIVKIGITMVISRNILLAHRFNALHTLTELVL
jgi:hypothetical protein